MLSFDSQKGVLTAGSFIPEEDFSPIVSTIYEEYESFLRGPKLKSIISDMFRELWEETKVDSLGYTEVEEVIVKDIEDASYQVDVVLYNPHLRTKNKVTEPFTFMSLPYVKKDGCIVNDGKHYGFIHYLDNKPGIYFSTNEDNERDNKKKNIRLVFDEGPIVTFMYSSNSTTSPIRIKIGGHSFDAIHVATELEPSEGAHVDMQLALRDIRYSRHSIISSNDRLRFNATGESRNDKGFTDSLERIKTHESYILSPETRSKINKILSLNRAIGEVLSDDVLIDNGSSVLYRKGTLVTEEVVEELNRHLVSKVFVKYRPNVTGMVLREDVKLYEFRKGSLIIDEIRDYFPEYENLMYLPEDIHWSKEKRLDQQGIFYFVSGEYKMNKDLLEFLEFNGITNLLMGASETTESLTVVFLSREIISNAQVECSVLGMPNTPSGYIRHDGYGNIIDDDNDRLTSWDIIAVISLLTSLSKGNDFNVITDLDISYSKKYSTLPEKVEQAMTTVWTKEFVGLIKQNVASKLKNNTQGLTDTKMMEGFTRRFQKDVWSELARKQLCLEMVDTMNPLSYLSSLRIVKTFVKDANAVAANRRYMSMYQLGRICPYETPPSNKVGLTGQLALGAKVVNGEPMARFYKMVDTPSGRKVDTSKEIRLTVEEEENLIVTTIDSLPFKDGDIELNLTGSSLNKLILARVPNPDNNTMEKCSIARVPAGMVDYVTVSPNDHISMVVSTLPLVGANDAVRITFDASMMKQARALIEQEAPLVYTDMSEQLFRYTDKYCRYAKEDGMIISAEPTVLIILYNSGEEEVIRLDPVELLQQTVIERYFVKTFEEGDTVKRNQLLISTNFDDNGVLAIGKNVLVGYIPVGKNYEDGVESSERIRQSLVSYRVNKQEGRFPKKLKRPLATLPHSFRYINKKSQIGKIIFRGKNRTARTERAEIADIELGFCLNFTAEKDAKKSGWGRGETWKYLARGLTANKLGSGDKLANRHGNKGVVPRSSKNSDMPQLPNGEFLDSIYNPHGVVSRMNIGQTLEANLALACKVLRIKCKTSSFGGITTDEIRLVLSYAHDLSNSTDVEKVISEYPTIPSGLHDHVRYNINLIRYWKDCFARDGSAILFNPKTGRKYNSPVIIGFNYISKLEQDSDTKLNARGYYPTSTYKASDSPTKGAANGGGQTLGNMEFAALLAYGAGELMHEMTNERGDNPIARVNFTVDKIHEGTGLKVSEDMSMRRSVLKYIMYMEALGMKVNISELGNIYDTEPEYMCYPTSKTLINASDEEIQSGANVKEDELDDTYMDTLRGLGIDNLLDFKT